MNKPYQPKTGLPCSCKRGQERDSCPACEGTGWQIDFRAIRNKRIQVSSLSSEADGKPPYKL